MPVGVRLRGLVHIRLGAFFKEKQSWEEGGDVLGDKKKIEYMYEFVFKCTEEKNSVQRHTGLFLQKIEEKERAEKQYTISGSRLKKCVQTSFMVTTGQWPLWLWSRPVLPVWVYTLALGINFPVG